MYYQTKFNMRTSTMNASLQKPHSKNDVGTGWFQGYHEKRISNAIWTDISDPYQSILIGVLDSIESIEFNSIIYITSKSLVNRVLYSNKLTKLEKETRDKLKIKNCTLKWDHSKKKEYNIAKRLAQKGAKTRTLTCFPSLFPISKES